MNRDELWDLLPEYFAGLCSDEDVAAINRWIAADPAVRYRVERERLLWELAARLVDAGPEPDAASALTALQRKLHRKASERTRVPFEKMRRPSRRNSWALAACLVGASGLAYWVVRDQFVGNADATESTQTFATERGQSSRITLPDESKILLGPDSRLTYTPLKHNRILTLIGEAYFEVYHDPARPFSVAAGNATMLDLGTHFVVRAYPADEDVRVAVAEGAVEVRSAGTSEPRVVPGGALGVVSATGETAVSAIAENDPLLAWRNGRLVFNRTPLGTVARDLSRWYDVDITLNGATLDGVLVSGSLPVATLKGALDAVAAVSGTRWERHGRLVTVFASATARSATPHATASR